MGDLYRCMSACVEKSRLHIDHGWCLVCQRDDLLASLKALADDYERLSGDGMTESNQPDELRAARAAIAKAERR